MREDERVQKQDPPDGQLYGDLVASPLEPSERGGGAARASLAGDRLKLSDAQRAEEWNPLAHAGQVARKAVYVSDIADGLLPMQPFGRYLTLVVELL